MAGRVPPVECGIGKRVQATNTVAKKPVDASREGGICGSSQVPRLHVLTTKPPDRGEPCNAKQTCNGGLSRWSARCGWLQPKQAKCSRFGTEEHVKLDHILVNDIGNARYDNVNNLVDIEYNALDIHDNDAGGNDTFWFRNPILDKFKGKVRSKPDQDPIERQQLIKIATRLTAELCGSRCRSSR